MNNRIISFLLISTFVFCSCKQLESKKILDFTNGYADTINASIVSGSFVESSPISIDSLLIIRFFSLFPDLNKYQNDVFQFYRKRSFESAWHDNSGIIEAYQILFIRVMQMEENGLTKQIPYLEDFKRYSNKPINDSTEFVDLMQTAQYFHFAHRVLEGLPEQKLHSLDWHIPKSKKNYTELLDKFILGEEDAFDQSIYPQYHSLKNALIQLQQIQKKGGWPLVQLSENSLHEGINHPAIIDIKKRLNTLNLYTKSD
jgi:murein L,D-transpeptidase YcbB/YkuD